MNYYSHFQKYITANQGEKLAFQRRGEINKSLLTFDVV